MKDFNERLRNERRKRNMTQTAFGKEINVSSATISTLEKGSRPSEETILKVAKALQWTDGDYADYSLGISKEQAEAVIREVERNMQRLGIVQLEMIQALGISIETYRGWRRNMKPHAKRELMKFARMDREAYDRSVKKYGERYIRKHDVEGLSVDENPLSSEELKELRTDRGWSQFKLAQKIGVNASTVGVWERGVKPIPKARIRQLYKLFGLRYAEVKRAYKTESQRKKEQQQRKELLNTLDILYDGNLSEAPEDCEYLNKFRELVGA